jgi:hypothetical protein
LSGGYQSAGARPTPLLFVFLDSPLSRRMTEGVNTPLSPSLKSGGPFLFFLLLAVYLGQPVLRLRSCDGEAPLQLLHLNL